MPTAYALGLDLGTSYTAGAIRRGERLEVASLGDRAAQVPSALYLRDDGTYLFGEAALRRGSEDPTRLAREFKRRLGDSTPIRLGHTPMSPEALTAKLLRWSVDTVTRLQGRPPGRLVITHPANWGSYRRELLENAVAAAEVGPATFCTEPEAAAVHFATTDRVAPGDTVVVYDLGGGTFDAAVLERVDGSFALRGTAEGIEHLGGVDFDEAIFEHVLESIGPELNGMDMADPAVTAAILRLRRECTDAKEALSTDTEARIPLSLPGLAVTGPASVIRITRGEFEAMIRPTLVDTVSCLRRAMTSAALTPEHVSAVVLVGGSARIPLVSELLASELGRPITVDPHPKHCVALGAALLAAASSGSRQSASPPPRPPDSGADSGSDGAGRGSGTADPPPRSTQPPLSSRADRPSDAAKPAASVTSTAGPRARGRSSSAVDFGPTITPWRPTAAAAVCTVAAVLLAVVPHVADPDPTKSDVVLNRQHTGSSARITVNFASPVTASRSASKLTLRLAGVTIAEPSLRNGQFDLGKLDWILAGPVKADLEISTGGHLVTAPLLLVPQKRSPLATIPGIAVIVAALFVIGYTESLLRPVRHRRRVRFVDKAGMFLLGGLAGLTLLDAIWAFGQRLPTVTAAVAVVLLMATAASLLPAITVARKQSHPRSGGA